MTTTLHSTTDNRVYTFTRINDQTTAVRSGWSRKAKGTVFWKGGFKRMPRHSAIVFYQQLLSSGWRLES